MCKRVILVAGLLGISVFWGACNSEKDTVKETENEVFAIHDEVMPKISDILKLRKQLNLRISVLDSLKAGSSGSIALRTDEEREQASRLSRDLTVADSLMTSWMSGYNTDTLTKISTDEAMRYLTAQKEQITDVKSKVNTSIEQARQYLGKK